MKTKSIVLTAVITLMLTANIFGQQMYMATSADGPVMFLDELAIVLKEKNKTVTIDFAGPAASRKEEYRKLDLQKGDKILMVNGKKLSSVDDAKKIYENMKTGEIFKMGLSRDNQMMMASFKKGDVERSHGGKQITTKLTGDPKNMLPVMELGFILQQKSEKLVVTNILPVAPKFIINSGVKEGDEVIKINGNTVYSIERFKLQYSKIKTEDDFEIIFKQKGKELKAAGKKPEQKGKMIIK